MGNSISLYCFKADGRAKRSLLFPAADILFGSRSTTSGVNKGWCRQVMETRAYLELHSLKSGNLGILEVVKG